MGIALKVIYMGTQLFPVFILTGIMTVFSYMFFFRRMKRSEVISPRLIFLTLQTIIISVVLVWLINTNQFVLEWFVQESLEETTLGIKSQVLIVFSFAMINTIIGLLASLYTNFRKKKS